MGILKEANCSKKYYLNVNPKNNLVDITLDNVARVEAMIHTDSNYRRSGDILAVPLGKYKGSSAYFISQLKPFVRRNILQSTPNLNKLFCEIISAINRENNTRISLTEINQIVNYLVSIQNNLIKRLYRRDFCLINDLVNCSRRKNYSFATKFCHYMCFYLFPGKRQQDNYSIYDRVVATWLGEYAALYGIVDNKGCAYKMTSFNSHKKYMVYSDVIDKVITASGSKISRNGFDHLIWYFHK